MIDVDADLAARLIAAQFPQWAALPVRAVDSQGWDNRTFRIGDKLKARFPRAAGYATQVETEARWLPQLALHLPVPIPAPVAMGAASEAYPFAWSMQTWIGGEVVDAQLAEHVALAHAVADFLKALRAAPAVGAPLAGAHNFHRGGSLAVYDRETHEAADALAGEIDVRRALAAWDDALATEWRETPVWVHGDMAAGNLLADDGRLQAVIDFGCLGAGDPACDLVIAWTLFRGEAREAFRCGVGLEDDCWARARGWALWKAMITLARDRGDAEARRVIGEVLEGR